MEGYDLTQPKNLEDIVREALTEMRALPIGTTVECGDGFIGKITFAGQLGPETGISWGDGRGSDLVGAYYMVTQSRSDDYRFVAIDDKDAISIAAMEPYEVLEAIEAHYDIDLAELIGEAIGD